MRLDLKHALRLIQSAHSLATALSDNSLAWYIELASLLVDFLGNKRRRSEDKAQLVDFAQLLSQLLKGINRETGCGNRHTAARLDGGHQIVAECLIYIVNKPGLHYGVLASQPSTP